jgi:hypothetical protein
MAGEIGRASDRTHNDSREVKDNEGRVMDRSKLSPAERETIIRTSDAEACWVVYSDSPAMIRQLKALVQRVGAKEEPAQTSTGYRCILPKVVINALVAKRQYRPLTEEERAGQGSPVTWPNTQQCRKYGGGNLE